MNISKATYCLLLLTGFWHCAFMWDKEFILHYILSTHMAIQVQEINWFISEYLNTESSENLQDFFNSIHRHTGITQMVITNNNDIKITKTVSKRRYMGIIMTNGAKDPIMKLHSRVLRGRRDLLNFVILVKPLVDFKKAQELLRMLYDKNFAYPFLFVQYTNGSSDLLGVNRYPKFAVRSRQNLLIHLKENYMKTVMGTWDCQGLALYTPLHLDLPGVFCFINNKNVLEVQGISLRIFRLFTKTINASLITYQKAGNKSCSMMANMKDILQLIRSKEISIAAHAYALFQPDEGIEKSFGITTVKWCLMVPIINNVQYFYYPIISYERPVWYAICVAYLALVIADCLWFCWERQKGSQQNRSLMLQITTSFMQNLCYLLFINSWKPLKRPTVVRFLLYAAVFFHGFFISISYSSLLGSILTVSSLTNQINTMDDLIRANLSTLIIDYELEFLLKLKIDLPSDFLQLIVAVDPTTFHSHRTTFNQSYAYFVCEHEWTFLRQQQANLRPELFKLTDICFGSFSLGFPMESDSPIYNYIAAFILRLHATGIINYFGQSSFRHAIRAGYVQRFKPDTDRQAADLSYVSMVFLMLIASSCVCTIVFLCECLHFRFKHKCNKLLPLIK